ncbi:hypothetical protein M2105_005661 [Paenibacillus sp. PastF-1]|nr:hypothetical protein [Paenibacillus sp. PastF-2]MDF9851866.1 hypothetical protein [Paenibacillus sp. PastM-2]MDF9857763.1 hypothetical protein [Paenibacillus sp. PastF-1]MDH6483030.1 hypothetical protein [Paenibacillus sp. PastH-2]MDH6509167.1 hypothetical protein [Paenibacillus sp. PastM-3]
MFSFPISQISNPPTSFFTELILPCFKNIQNSRYSIIKTGCGCSNNSFFYCFCYIQFTIDINCSVTLPAVPPIRPPRAIISLLSEESAAPFIAPSTNPPNTAALRSHCCTFAFIQRFQNSRARHPCKRYTSCSLSTTFSTSSIYLELKEILCASPLKLITSSSSRTLPG